MQLYKFPNISNLGIVVSFIGATLDFAVNKTTLTFPDLWRVGTKMHAPYAFSLASLNPCNSLEITSSPLTCVA